MHMTTVSLIRHGLVHNPQQVYYGRLPGFSLAEQGRQQAAAAGRYLLDKPIAAIYHSPMLRAAETAEIVRAHCGAEPPLVETPLLNEIHSVYDGRTVKEMEGRDWNFYGDVSPPYEEPADVLERMIAFFELARREHPGGHVVGVSHADPIAFTILWAAGLPLSAEGRKRLTDCGIDDSYPAHASVSTFFFDESQGELTGFEYASPSGGAF